MLKRNIKYLFSKEIRNYRTEKRNAVFDIMDKYSMSYGETKRTASSEAVPLCGRRDSNPHASRHQILSLARLPITTRPRAVVSKADANIGSFFDSANFSLEILHHYRNFKLYRGFVCHCDRSCNEIEKMKDDRMCRYSDC